MPCTNGDAGLYITGNRWILGTEIRHVSDSTQTVETGLREPGEEVDCPSSNVLLSRLRQRKNESSKGSDSEGWIQSRILAQGMRGHAFITFFVLVALKCFTDGSIHCSQWPYGVEITTLRRNFSY